MNRVTKNDLMEWISKTESIGSLQSIRAKTNKRIKSLLFKKEESPFKNIPIEKKREILKDLFVNDATCEKESKK